jgi:hypothetical protein
MIYDISYEDDVTVTLFLGVSFMPSFQCHILENAKQILHLKAGVVTPPVRFLDKSFFFPMNKIINNQTFQCKFQMLFFLYLYVTKKLYTNIEVSFTTCGIYGLILIHKLRTYHTYIIVSLIYIDN